MKLYELKEVYNNILEMIENGETTAEMMDTSLKQLDDEIEDKAKNIAYIVNQLTYDKDVITKEITRLNAKKESVTKNIDNLKEYLKTNMLATNNTKIKTETFSIYVRNNAMQVDMINENIIPEKYITFEQVEPVKKIDKKAILEDLKNGIVVNGAKIKQSKSLIIR